ncbi:hypothetical protein [Cohnella sp. WQ 127256]|uniref:hypothetical protein n=1 Tax=Cohnella sp. WQ 127256 TaxID=2938790 RepID=UPI002117C9C4|nr:hypothetical protein [Cohnella sp. WQ 127256]
MLRSLLILVLGAVLLTSCANNNLRHSPSHDALSSASSTDEASPSEVGNVNDYWNALAKQGLMMSPFVESEPPLEYVRIGLKHTDPTVRWFSVYKMLKYSLNQQDLDEIEQLTKDSEQSVQQAALFALSVVQEQFDGDQFVRSPVNGEVAFHLYHEARYNDGELWVAREGKVERLTQLEGSITEMIYSPDGKWISAEYGGRIWGALALIDVNTGERSLPDVLAPIIADPGNGYDFDPQKVDRFDPYIQVVEWSPDSTRLLVSYEFSSGLDHYHYGWAVYQLEAKKVIKVFKSDHKSADKKPEGFSWDNVS